MEAMNEMPLNEEQINEALGAEEVVEVNERQQILSAYEKPAMSEPAFDDGSEESKEKYRIATLEIDEFADEYNLFVHEVMYKGRFNGAENLSEEQKDTLWHELQTDWTIKFNEMCSALNYNLFLTHDEVLLLHTIFTKHVEYDLDFIFYGKLIENKIDELSNIYMNKMNKDVYPLNMTFNQVQAFVHLMKTYKWKGIGNKGNHMFNIMTKIMNLTAVRDYYRNIAEKNSGHLMSFISSISTKPSANIQDNEVVYEK